MFLRYNFWHFILIYLHVLILKKKIFFKEKKEFSPGWGNHEIWWWRVPWKRVSRSIKWLNFSVSSERLISIFCIVKPELTKEQSGCFIGKKKRLHLVKWVALQKLSFLDIESFIEALVIYIADCTLSCMHFRIASDCAAPFGSLWSWRQSRWQRREHPAHFCRTSRYSSKIQCLYIPLCKS